MAKYQCSVCGYIFDEEKTGYTYDDLLKCPACKFPKERLIPWDEVVKEIEEENAEAGQAATLIVYAHPRDDSFNNAVLDAVCGSLSEYSLIDLYSDGFDPAMTAQELSMYKDGDFCDPLVERYARMLDSAKRAVFIFPIWWYDMPAMLRGFFDKVMLVGSAYDSDADGLHPLRDIESTYLFTTSSSTTEELVEKFGDPIHGANIAATLELCGFHDIVWKNMGAIDTSSDDERREYLDEVRAIFDSLEAAEETEEGPDTEILPTNEEILEETFEVSPEAEEILDEIDEEAFEAEEILEEEKQY